MRAMRNAGGYVKVYRSMLDWEWYDDDACTRLMLHLILSANWEPKEWHGQKVEPGQIITSMDGLAGKLRLSRAAIRRAIFKLKSTGEIAIQTNNHWTTITLANWAEYQEAKPTNSQQLPQQTTDQQPTNDQPPATTKEGKNIRREEKKEEVAALPFGSDAFAEAWNTWEACRREARKPIGPTARRLQLKKLAAMGEPRAIAALLHSAESNYQGIYEPSPAAAAIIQQQGKWHKDREGRWVAPSGRTEDELHAVEKALLKERKQLSAEDLKAVDEEAWHWSYKLNGT